MTEEQIKELKLIREEKNASYKRWSEQLHSLLKEEEKLVDVCNHEYSDRKTALLKFSNGSESSFCNICQRFIQ
jgi:hypothetical protein